MIGDEILRQTMTDVVADDIPGTGACPVRADNKRRRIGEQAEHRSARIGCETGVMINAWRPMNMCQLTWVMHRVASDERFLSARRDHDADMPWRVPTRRNQADFVADLVIRSHQIDQAGVQYRLYRISEGFDEHRAHSFAANRAQFSRPVFEFSSVEEVARVREGRRPLSIDQHGIPAHMVAVEMGAKHRVYRVT